ncbi:hypothetical protein [Sinorhizobium sp. GL28]|uniref:hypothetical protein n=1 Tax=Sinorhizobium sp. GL28 TaxID=1358418 RepID=UPI00072BC2C9|nr:hypothetical protein [Sinorhizobium sp. GL28]KSV86616.1 hypothetical protein N184_10870 [Sinorhizobium sp. GL28]
MVKRNAPAASSSIAGVSDKARWRNYAVIAAELSWHVDAAESMTLVPAQEISVAPGMHNGDDGPLVSQDVNNLSESS